MKTKYQGAGPLPGLLARTAGGRPAGSDARRESANGPGISATASRAGLAVSAPRLLVRQLPALGVILVFAVLLRDRVADLDFGHIRSALVTVGPGQWIAGAALTAISFWSLGRYDVVVHRLVGRDTDPRRAARTGMTAIAIGQTVGLGAITGTFVRWRMLPGLGLIDATRISIIVSFSFLSAWVVVTAAAVIMLGAALPHARLAAALVIAVAFMLVVLSVWRPGALARLTLPPLKAMALILIFTTIDTVAASAVLWAMLPEGLSIPFPTLLTAYLLALGAGLVLTTPGGVGPFEVALLALLPDAPAEPLLAAVLAYRAVYYAAPAVIGALLLARPPTRPPLPEVARADLNRVDPNHLPLKIEAALDTAPRAEAALLRHGRFHLLSNLRNWPAALVARSGQSLILLGDPLARDSGEEVLAGLTDRAALTLAVPVVYKCGARFATRARRAGWQVLPIAREGWVDPRVFSDAGADRRNLRRKLRKAEGAGLVLTTIYPGDPAPLPLSDMEDLADRWRAARGGERGFSMGVWDPGTLRHALIILAHDAHGRLRGFVTCHMNRHEATLDLMRQDDGAPDGMTYRLVDAAIRAAGDAGLARFSLASVPFGVAPGELSLFRYLRRQLDNATGAEGLRQFKTAFGPRWETLYLAAPNRLSLVLGAVDIVREITRQEKRPTPGHQRP
ncbi:phosphatidylglycerol lysyltransferase domain-containing protein [uncultured Maritimibacter sp.]|jgi:phosphatidylglycerol lysyltransferase|uniref:phosphatidylglycerol lysyltransferase domain-containing protein n=1 Tax=uncultured Maritimibacter sp. TaxID=991866 RepID=UPI0026241131|nr:phosphatidylglycerol lysyltransferase domain-containing protein [uncultured Maritimibacter sp.]